MYSSLIEEIIRSHTDKNKFNTGFSFFKRNLVINDYSKVDGDNITFYATVIDENHRNNYTAIISINTKTRVISNMSCDCHSLLSNTKPQICSHIVATVLNGLENLNKESNDEYIDENITINPNITLDISQSRNGYMNMKLDIDGVDSNEYRDIFSSYKNNNRLYRMKNGAYLDLKDKDLEQAFKLIDILNIYNDFDNMKIPNNKAIYLEKLIEDEDLNFVKGSKYVSNVVKKFNKVKSKNYEIPKDLNATLRDYQVSGFEFFKTLSDYEFGAILADEMGLGKTIQTIAFLLSNKDKKSIVITPTALIYNWKSELEKFAPTLKVGILHAVKSEREKILDNIDNYDVLLTTYTTYKNDIDKYKNINFDYCIIDEAQNIKNPDAIITKAIKKINAKVRFALTGTPIENNLMELWSIFDFIMPGYLYNKSKFKSIFVNNDKNIIELKKLIKPFILRRTKKEVITELPDKIEQKIIIDLEKEHKKAYKGYVNLITRKIKENNQDNITVFSYLTKLRQLCLSPELMVKNYQGRNSKLDVLINIIKDSSDKKILVFSQFTKVLEVIGKRLNEENISYSYLDGKTSAKDRVKLVEEFNTNNNKVFLISLKAGGTGLNLTSANIVVHFDPWWNPAVEDQASDRAHRIGQKNVVNVIKLIAKNTAEERVINLQETKKEIIEDVINGNLDNSSTLKNLSKDDIIDLFMS
ncbi:MULTISPECIES: DEAD/DEAH box helicase [Romboutsia]|jgi:SNF2 family DNA or RNA helicase|uniref:DEAD/DEAH box helicase n=1 Tax=Romboutsia TaxID=1501226 RepID=UPI00216F76EE|nr:MULTISPECIES: DEAD/DEAH box helicase [Romboutsia]MCI9062198.1 DEAD/DEAH box helicase [Romboutsia sp.]